MFKIIIRTSRRRGKLSLQIPYGCKTRFDDVGSTLIVRRSPLKVIYHLIDIRGFAHSDILATVSCDLRSCQKSKTQSALVLGVLAFWRHIVKMTSSNTSNKVTSAIGAQLPIDNRQIKRPSRLWTWYFQHHMYFIISWLSSKKQSRRYCAKILQYLLSASFTMFVVTIAKKVRYFFNAFVALWISMFLWAS